jgi:phosphoserine/homoserine phosphotransferase
VISIGDSYNDATMLSAADFGILFRPSQKVVNDFPQFKACEDYESLKIYIKDYLKSSD